MGGHPRYAHCKWALLLHDVGKPATARKVDGRLRFFDHEHVGARLVLDMATRYRWSADETGRYAKLVRHHMRPGSLAVQPEVTDKAVHRFFRDLGEDALAMLLVSLADHLTYLSAAQRRRRNSPHELLTLRIIRRYFHQRRRLLPEHILNGHDIMRAFSLKPSRLIGTLLTELQEAQAEGRVKGRDDGLAYLKGRVQWHTAHPTETTAS